MQFVDPVRNSCLILACGNTLRSDDGVGPWLASWAEERFAGNDRVRVLMRQQWTPDLAADVAEADTTIFIDCSIESEAGQVLLREVTPEPAVQGLATHHTGAPHLLAMAMELYGRAPERSLLLTVGAGSIELGEEFSAAVTAALPAACELIESTIRQRLQRISTAADSLPV